MEKYQATRVIKTCDWAPAQWEVETKTEKLYVRYRWGWLELWRWSDLCADSGEAFHSAQIGSGFDADMDTPQMMRLTSPYVDYAEIYGTYQLELERPAAPPEVA